MTADSPRASTSPEGGPSASPQGRASASPEGQDVGPSPRTRLGAYAVVRDDAGRILLVRLAADEVEAGAWTLPGGGVEFGEHPDATVLRELEEETGLTGRIDDILGIFSRVYPRSRAAAGADLHFVGFLYRVSMAGGTLRDEVGGSSDGAAWFPPGELANVRLVGVAREAIRRAVPEAELAATSGSAEAPTAAPTTR